MQTASLGQGIVESQIAVSGEGNGNTKELGEERRGAGYLEVWEGQGRNWGRWVSEIKNSGKEIR